MGRRSGTQRRRAPQQERSRAKVDAILRAAEEVLERDGYAATSTDRIAIQAGVAVGTLYSYFRDRDEVLTAMVHRLLAEVAGELTPALLAWPSLPLGEGLAGLLRSTLTAIAGRRELARIVLGHVAGVMWMEEVSTVRAQVQGLFEHAVRQALPAADDARRRLVVNVLSQAVEGVMLAVASDPQAGDEAAVVEETVRLVEAYLGAVALAEGRG